MKRIAIFALAALMLWPLSALAAGLSGTDYQFLKAQYGLERDDAVLAGLSVSEQAELHGLINDEAWADRPARRNLNVAEFLYRMHERDCGKWSQSHPGQECPPGANASVEPGRKVAERNCNTCHLFGTSDAPSFYQLAKRGGWSAETLTSTLKAGHAMSPITLQPEESAALAAYIASLKK